MKDAVEVEPGVWSIIEANRSYEVRVARPWASVNGLAIELEDTEGGPESGSRGAAFSHGPVLIKAPMPGKIVKVLVTPGEEVRNGQSVVVVEAMKMQNALKCPRDGKVTAVHAREHDAVNAGSPLVTIE